MKTLEQIFDYQGGENCNFIDGRDKSRLAQFLPADKLEHFGFKVVEGKTHEPVPFTLENVMDQLADDLEFAFDKALNQRGISASLMFDVVKMWMWVLDDEELANFGDYPQYGLPLLKRVAVKYNLPNRIGDDIGDEYKYESRR